MVEIRPFKATIINPQMQVDKLICPVYDTIDAANYQKFANEKNNIIHVTTRRKDMDRDKFIECCHKRTRTFQQKKGTRSEKKNLHFIFTASCFPLQPETLAMIPEKDRRSLYFVFGLVSLVKVEELGKGSIVGHENIFEINSNERYRLDESKHDEFLTHRGRIQHARS